MARPMMALMGVFEDVAGAENAIAAMQSIGVRERDISLLAHEATIPAARGAIADANGTLFTPVGLAVTLVGIVLCAIPLAGLLTAGPLAILGGAASLWRTGNPVDDLAELGVDRADAKIAHECLRRGAIIVVALCDRPLVRRAAGALARAGAIDFRARAAAWEAEGWEYEPNAPMWSAAHVEASKEIRVSDRELLPIGDETPTAV